LKKSVVKITKSDGSQEVRPVTRYGRLHKLPSQRQLSYLSSLWAELGTPDRRMPETRQGAFMAIRNAKRKLETQDRLRPASMQKPSEGQLHDLAVLAGRRGEAPPVVATRGEAARELARLRKAVAA
jgi:hypothetical protein